MDVAHKHWWQTFEVVFGIPFLVAIVLQWAVPVALPYGFLLPVILAAGVALLLLGAALVVLARREFARQGQPTDPGHPTGRIVSTSVYAISRNPLYLGGICILVGIALLINLPWVFVLLLPSIVACHFILILPEESYLASKFDGEYARYAASVHRWLGRSGNAK